LQCSIGFSLDFAESQLARLSWLWGVFHNIGRGRPALVV